MRRLRLWEGAVRLWLHRVDHVGKLDGVLDEEYRDVVADEVPVALLGIELHGEPAHVPGEVERSLAPGHRGETDEGFCLLANTLEDVGAGDIGERFRQFEVPVGAIPSRVDDPFRDALMIEMEDLLAEVEVFEQR